MICTSWLRDTYEKLTLDSDFFSPFFFVLRTKENLPIWFIMQDFLVVYIYIYMCVCTYNICLLGFPA